MSFNQQLVTNPCKLNTYDTKCLKFINDALKETSESFEKEQKLSDKVLLNLYNIFGGVFERALELYEQARITHIFPSETTVAASHNERNNARYLVQVKGFSGSMYTFFPDINYCICTSFRCQVINERSLFTCKHVLAAWLATVTKYKLLYRYVTEKQFQNLLLYQVSYEQHVF